MAVEPRVAPAILAVVMMAGGSSLAGEPAAHPPAHGAANAHMQQIDFDTLVARFEAPARAAWQKPDAVIASLGDLTGKTVVDLGAGTGYFSFRLAAAGARVVAADVDPRFQAFIERRKIQVKPAPGTVDTRLLTHDSPGLSKGEADLVLMVDVYHHIEQRQDYFRKVREGLKGDGKLVVIDFMKTETPEGPPLSMRVAPEQVQRELAIAGFKTFTVDSQLLPYQYIVTAQ